MFDCIYTSLSFVRAPFSGEAQSLYTVLPEKSAAVGAAMMGSSHVYDMASVSVQALYCHCAIIRIYCIGCSYYFKEGT